MIGIVCSRADEASKHVVEHVLELGAFETVEDGSRPDAEGGGTVHRSDAFEVRTVDDLHLELDGVAAAFGDASGVSADLEYVVFASRHSGDTGELLSAHVTGNFGPAEYGGEDRSLAAAPPNALAAVLERLDAHAPPGYDVGLEVTHHGPSDVGAPSMFVELGSGPEQWDDADAARAVARAILDLADVPAYAPREPVSPASGDVAADATAANAAATAGAEATRRHLVGFGGGHYAPRFTRLARETDWAVGHVAADWALSDLGDPAEHPDVLASAFEQSAATHAVVDGDRPGLAAAIEDLGYRVVGETWVRETDEVPLSLVATAESRVTTVADGLRLGAPARDASSAGSDVDPDGCSEIALPADLLAAAQGVDREGVLAALDAHCVAYETEESGTRAGDRALVPGRARLPDGLRDALVDVLREQYDDVRVGADEVVATTSAFDPALAREASVPEGPAFGRLADGDAVDVDGRTVEPDDVRTERRDVFEL